MASMDVIVEKLDALEQRSELILTQTRLTNGRVNVLEQKEAIRDAIEKQRAKESETSERGYKAPIVVGVVFVVLNFIIETLPTMLQ